MLHAGAKGLTMYKLIYCVAVAGLGGQAVAGNINGYAGRKLPDFTITVAASDTKPPARRRAHFVCDGVGDQVEIQAAIDFLPVAGGTVRLLAGQYNLNKSPDGDFCVQINKSNVRLLLDPGVVLKLADNQFNGLTGYVIQFGDGTTTLRENVGIVGLGTIDGNEANNTGGAQPQHNAIVYFTGDFQNVLLGHGLTLTESTGVGLNFDGVTKNTSKNIRLVDLSITNGDDDGILCSGIDGMFVSNLLIDTMDAQDGFEPLQVFNLLMVNSVIRNTFGSAIDIFNGDTEDGSTKNSHHRYVNCTFGPMTSPASVIAIASGAKNIHSDIVFDSCFVDMTDARRGIRVGGTSTSIPRDVVFHNVVVDGTGSRTGNSWGIVVDERAERTSILASIIHNCSTDGILIEGGSGTEAVGTLVQACRVYNNGTRQVESRWHDVRAS